MIDENEIDIAARAQALSKHINETAYFQLRSIEDFKDGARWAINEFLKDLWHDASEEPERDRDILLEYENGHPSDVRMRLPYQYENIYSSLCEKYWSAMVKIEKITRWLYIDDLLTKEGGNHD